MTDPQFLLELMIPPTNGRVAQWLEHPSRIREVPGSIPGLVVSYYHVMFKVIFKVSSEHSAI